MLIPGVLIAGSAGMYAFESNLAGEEGLETYGEALWWTAMILTTVGSQYWPQTA
jgi:voltage-gated potassium channel